MRGLESQPSNSMNGRSAASRSLRTSAKNWADMRSSRPVSAPVPKPSSSIRMLARARPAYGE